LELVTTLLLIYLVVVIGIALAARFGGQSGDDFVIGSRQIGTLGLTAAIFATLMTESLVFFCIGLAVRFGPTGAICASLGPSMALLVLSFGAERARRVAADQRFVCVSEFCRAAWGPVAGRMAKIIINGLLVWVMILQIHLNGKLLGGLLDWSQVLSTVVSVGVVATYLALGGFRAVVKTDLFQTLVVLIIVMVPFFMVRTPTVAVFESDPGLSPGALLLCGTSFSMTIVRPEMWQRIYSARSGAVAARALRNAVLMFVVACSCILYYAFAVIEVMPDATPVEAFVDGFSRVLSPAAAAFVPVVLLSAMMSGLDSAAFLFSMNVMRMRESWAAAPLLWGRIVIIVILLVAAFASLYIYEALSFAYQINGFMMLFTVPLLVSMRRRIDPPVLLPALAAGLAVYLIQIAIGRIEKDPSEAIFGSLTTALVLGAGLLFQWLRRAEPEQVKQS
jgi:sodium/proline symporter